MGPIEQGLGSRISGCLRSCEPPHSVPASQRAVGIVGEKSPNLPAQAWNALRIPGMGSLSPLVPGVCGGLESGGCGLGGSPEGRIGTSQPLSPPHLQPASPYLQRHTEQSQPGSRPPGSRKVELWNRPPYSTHIPSSCGLAVCMGEGPEGSREGCKRVGERGCELRATLGDPWGTPSPGRGPSPPGAQGCRKGDTEDHGGSEEAPGLDSVVREASVQTVTAGHMDSRRGALPGQRPGGLAELCACQAPGRLVESGGGGAEAAASPNLSCKVKVKPLDARRGSWNFGPQQRGAMEGCKQGGGYGHVCREETEEGVGGRPDRGCHPCSGERAMAWPTE